MGIRYCKVILLFGMFGVMGGCFDGHSRIEECSENSSVVVMRGEDGPVAIRMSEEDEADFLLKKGLLMVEKMCSLAQDTNYISYSAKDKIVLQLLKSFAECDLYTGCKVFEIGNLQEYVHELTEGQLLYNKDVYDSYYSNMVMRINSASGTRALIAASLVCCEKYFYCDGLKKATLYLYSFKGGQHCMILFLPKEEGIVKAFSSFVVNPMLAKVKTEEDVEMFLDLLLGFQDASVCLLKKW